MFAMASTSSCIPAPLEENRVPEGAAPRLARFYLAIYRFVNDLPIQFCSFLVVLYAGTFPSRRRLPGMGPEEPVVVSSRAMGEPLTRSWGGTQTKHRGTLLDKC